MSKYIVARSIIGEPVVSGKKFFFVFLFVFIVLGISVSSQEAEDDVQVVSSYTQSANYRTALRCLELSKGFLVRSEWTNAALQAELGCVYDDSISDLWYVVAEARFMSGATAADVLPLVAAAMEKSNWVDTNRDSARILYARLLCDTTDPVSALEQLDATPVLYSAEAEYLRVLCYYRLGTDESYAKARERVAAASRLFPNDNRFPHVFFTYELNDDLSFSEDVAQLAEVFVNRFVEPYEIPAELAIYAAAFADGEVQNRMLRAIEAAGLRHPLYASVALKAGVLSEYAAYDYFCSFAENSMSLRDLRQFASLLSEPAVKSALKAFLSAYNGILSYDFSGDGCDDMTVDYARGRPLFVSCDQNQDGVADWTASCDFGVPTEVCLADDEGNDTVIRYKDYPYVSSAVVGGVGYSFVADSLDWTPLFIYADDSMAKELDGFQFFVPTPKGIVESMSEPELLSFASSVEVDTPERKAGRVKIAILDGTFRQAQYFDDEKLYATLMFDSGVPSVRNVDADGDGRFELTEAYAFSPERFIEFVGEDNSEELYRNLFGSISFNPGVYLSSISVDLNSDTRPDFHVEYLPEGDSVSTWGDADKWTAKYSFHSADSRAEAMFRLPAGNETISISMEKNVPVYVQVRDSLDVPVRDMAVVPVDGVYWLGKTGGSDISRHLKMLLESDGRQGVCFLEEFPSENEDKPIRFTAIRINGFYFGVILDE